MDHAAQDGTTVLLSKSRRWASLVVLSASLLVITMDMTILNVALPQMTAELKPTSEQVLWMVDAYSLALAGLLVTMSGLGDRLGRRRVLIIGYVLFGVGSGFALIANSAALVIALRVVLGVGGAMIMPTTLSLIRSVFPHPKERSTAIAVWAAVSALGILFIWINGTHLTFGPIVVAMLCIGVGEGALTAGSAMIMSATPPEKAGNVAAIEGVSYDLGNVLGVAVIGSIASLLYKANFDTGMLAALDPPRAAAAKESLGGALDIAHATGLPDVASHAIAAFNASLSGASLVGGIIMFIVAAAAFFTIPKKTDIDTQSP